MKRFLPLFCLFVLLGVGACARQVPPAPLSAPETTLVARVDSLGLAEFLDLPASEQARRRELSHQDLRRFQEWKRNLELRQQALRLQNEDYAVRLTDGWGRRTEDKMDKLIPELHRAVNTDPTNAWAAYELGRLLAVIGDRPRALERLAQAWEAVPYCPDTEWAEAIREPALLELAWLCYETGRAEAAWRWLARGEGRWTGNQAHDVQLISGLLHALQGDFKAADRVAGEMPPFTFGSGVRNAQGEGSRRTGYANRWILAMAWLRQGDPEHAYQALQPVFEYSGKAQHAAQYWQDVALVCELSGRSEEANRHYGKAFVSHWPEVIYFPYQGFVSNPLIHDLPDPRVPFWTSWHEHLLAGSLFSYAARQIDNTYLVDDEVQLAALRRRAVQALDVCVRRGIRVDESRALRGWVLYDLGETEAAMDDLRSAQQAFVAEGAGDATTSLLLGTYSLQNGDAVGAIPDLQDAVRLDPVYGTAWRTYGVALATLRRFHEAEAAMDRALEIDPYAAGGWHNRGLMNMNLQRWREAYADLAVASRLAPGNPETEQMLSLARRNWLKESGETGRGPADAHADSLAAALRSGTPLLAWPSRPVNLSPRAVRISDIDHVACADSLGFLFAAAPDDTLRLRLAEESLLAGRPDTTLDLLASEWRGGLTLVEQRLVLQADRALGLNDRARELADALLAGDPVCADAPLWSLVAACCLDAGLRDEGIAALDRAVFLDPTNHALKSFRLLVGRQGGP